MFSELVPASSTTAVAAFSEPARQGSPGWMPWVSSRSSASAAAMGCPAPSPNATSPPGSVIRTWTDYKINVAW